MKKTRSLNLVIAALLAVIFSAVGAGCVDGQGMNTPASQTAGLNIDGTGSADNCEGVYNPPTQDLGKSCQTWNDCLDVAPALLSGALPPLFCVHQSDVNGFGWPQALVGKCSAQADSDLDGAGDECDDDNDNDGDPNVTDCEPFVPSIHHEAREVCDGVDNNCDGRIDESFNNNDNDGKADCVDPDDDNDGILDGVDNCQFTANPDQKDTDGDGIGDACSNDFDGDGKPNTTDNCPMIPNPDQKDTDVDGIGDACDPDLDGDGKPNATDNCPAFANPDQSDIDEDGLGDVCDTDCDGDGVPEVLVTELPNACTGDYDGDGYVTPEDCLEGNAAFHPGAVELCDGYDNDCDGQTDEGANADCAEGQTCIEGACMAPECSVAADCNDNISSTTDTCVAGVCSNITICVPQCSNKECGDNGCGGTCGTCGDGLACNTGMCEAVPFAGLSVKCPAGAFYEFWGTPPAGYLGSFTSTGVIKNAPENAFAITIGPANLVGCTCYKGAVDQGAPKPLVPGPGWGCQL